MLVYLRFCVFAVNFFILYKMSELQEIIVNKVASSGINTLNLEDYYPKGERIVFDMKNCLIEGLVLREKEFRNFLKQNDWTKYKDKFVAIDCSADAIIPTWAYMLVAIELEPFAKKIILGTLNMLETLLFREALSKINLEEFKNQRVVIKGCSAKTVPVSAYIEIVRLLRPVAQSIMYGEPCSTVPLYKKNKNTIIASE